MLQREEGSAKKYYSRNGSKIFTNKFRPYSCNVGLVKFRHRIDGVLIYFYFFLSVVCVSRIYILSLQELKINNLVQSPITSVKIVIMKENSRPCTIKEIRRLVIQQSMKALIKRLLMIDMFELTEE